MQKTKSKPTTAEITKRFKRSIIEDFHPVLIDFCEQLPFNENTVHKIIGFIQDFNFKQDLKDSKKLKPKEKPLKSALSGIKAGIFDPRRGRFIQLAEYVFTNIHQLQTNKGWCQFSNHGNCLLIKAPCRNRWLECWIVLFLHV